MDQAACGSNLTCFQGTCSCATGSIYDGASRFYGFDSTLISRDGATTLSTNGSCVFEADRFGVAGRAVKPSTCGAGKPEVADSPEVRGATLTVAAWVKINGSGGGGHIVVKNGWSGAAGEQYSMNLRPTSGGFGIKQNSACIPGNGWVEAGGTLSAPVNMWVHAVGVFDGSNIKFFLNGQLVHSQPSVGFSSIIDNCQGAPLRIGSNWSGDPQTFDGLIDDVAIWTRGLSDAEVSTLYQSSLQCGG